MIRPMLLAMMLIPPLPVADGPRSEASERELRRHQGTWIVTSMVREGQEAPAEIVASIRRIVEGEHVVWKRDGKRFAGTALELDPAADPKAIDVIPDGGPSRGEKVRGIYELDGETLRICMAGPGQDRPKAFRADKGSGHTLTTFRREAPEKPKGPPPCP
jgi:uncharacterized protein (TIGR03067 family)